MAVRIRVYPQYGGLGMNGLGMNRMGGAVSASTYFNTKLQTQKQISNLQLGYERALWNERLEKVRLEERLKNPYALAQQGGLGVAGYGGYGGYGLPVQAGYNPYAASLMGSSMLGGSGFFGSLGLGGMF
ncbi:MAG: hypothetical protein JWM86_422 [Thermoleophilia bacterium]|nr:hypothetical protein [Thermoleophilia bacterium]